MVEPTPLPVDCVERFDARQALISEAETLAIEAHRYLAKHHASRNSIELIRSLRVMVHQLVEELKR